MKSLQVAHEALNFPMGDEASLSNFSLALRGYLATLISGVDAAMTRIADSRPIDRTLREPEGVHELRDRIDL